MFLLSNVFFTQIAITMCTENKQLSLMSGQNNG